MTRCHSIMVYVQVGGLMPKKAFFNLETSKRKKLEDAALKEFSKYTYDQISINRIILQIGMPRGSFYLYFSDKEDLYLYIIDKYHNILLDLVVSVIEKNDDLIESFKCLFEGITNYTKNGTYCNLFKKFFVGLNHDIEKKVFHLLTDEQRTNVLHLLIQKYSSNLKCPEDIMDILDVLVNILVHALTGYYIINIDIDVVRKHFYKQLEIVKNGIY